MTVKSLPIDRYLLMYTPGSEIEHPEFQELLIAYGQAMWSWSRVENKLFRIFVHAIEPTTTAHFKAIRAAFFSVVSPRARLDMIHSVATAMWRGKGHWNDWIAIYTECGKELTKRGRLAHLVGYGFYIPEPNGRRESIVAVLGEPIDHPLAPRNHSDLRRGEFNADTLSKHAQRWERLNARLGVFCSLAQEVQRAASSPLSDHLRQLLQMPESPIRKERTRRQKPSRPKP